jgi:hypothetical protein
MQAWLRSWIPGTRKHTHTHTHIRAQQQCHLGWHTRGEGDEETNYACLPNHNNAFMPNVVNAGCVYTSSLTNTACQCCTCVGDGVGEGVGAWGTQQRLHGACAARPSRSRPAAQHTDKARNSATASHTWSYVSNMVICMSVTPSTYTYTLSRCAKHVHVVPLTCLYAYRLCMDAHMHTCVHDHCVGCACAAPAWATVLE